MVKGQEYPKVWKFDHDEAVCLYQSGLSAPKVAAIFKVTHRAIFCVLKSRCIQPRTRGQARNALAQHRRINAYGYVMIRVGPRQYRPEHRMIAERVLGRPLKRREYVHHINENRADNRNDNLLICTHDYHATIHARMRASEFRLAAQP